MKYRHELQQLIRERNLLSRVFLYPAVAHEQINEVFSAGDLFLMSSMYEPFGIVTIEAMAMGLPVVAANSGGSVNIITHNQTGILTDFQDPHRVATYLFSLLRDEDTYERIAKAALRQAKRNYDWTEKSAQFAAQYRQISRREESEFFQKVIKHNYFLQQHFSI
jgi:1,4-alpha-glucan branching enzyme